MHDLISGQRLLFKVFGAKEEKLAFNESDPFDVFRKLAEFAVRNFSDAERIAPFVAFVRQPIRPRALQRVGLGVPSDIIISGRNYVILNGECKPFGYEVLFDLTEVYKLGRIFVDYEHKDIYVPGTELIRGGYVTGTNIEGYAVTSPVEAIWVVPKMQFCSSQALGEVFPFYKKVDKYDERTISA